MRLGVALLGSELEPAYRFGIVLRDAFSIVVYDPEVVLRLGVTLVGSLPDRVEIVLCREHHDGEATHHEHGSSYTDQPCILFIGFKCGLLSPLQTLAYPSQDARRIPGVMNAAWLSTPSVRVNPSSQRASKGIDFLDPPGNSPPGVENALAQQFAPASAGVSESAQHHHLFRLFSAARACERIKI